MLTLQAARRFCAIPFVVLSLVIATHASAQTEPDSPAEPGETRDQLIARGMRMNSDGNYDAARAIWQQLREMDPGDPAPHVYAVDTLFWLMVYEDSDLQYDKEIESECAQAVRKGEQRLVLEPESAESHFLLGQAFMHLGRLNGIRLRVFKAGQLGERAREHLERALVLDPELVDAKFPLGIYFYYASLVPSLVKWFAWLWFIPTGNADLGLQYLEDVRSANGIHAFGAGFYLATIRTYHGGRRDLPKALDLMGGIHSQHPRNTLVHFELLEILEVLGRYEDVIAEALGIEAYAGDASHERGRANMARVWRARAELYLRRPDRAWEILEVFGENGPVFPNWGPRWVQATRGQILDLRGDRAAALAQYQRVADLDLSLDYSRSASIAQSGLAEPFSFAPADTGGSESAAQ